MNYTASEDGMTITDKKGKKRKYYIRYGKYQTGINIFGKYQIFPVARLVYWYFNPKWDIRNKFQIVGFIDNNSLNVNKDNLYLKSWAEAHPTKLSLKKEKRLRKEHVINKISISKLAKKYKISETLVKKILKKEEL